MPLFLKRFIPLRKIATIGITRIYNTKAKGYNKFLIFLVLIASLTHFTVQADQSLNVSVTIPPKASDFQFSFASIDGQTQVPENTTLSYQITYGAQSSAGVSSDITIVADFSDDRASGNIHVLDYITGSATNAYGNTTPVIDVINRTITWTIHNFPAGITDQTITFQLQTNSNYSGNHVVPFTIKAKMNNQYVTMPDQTVSQSYFFVINPVTSTPTPSPTPVIPVPVKIIGVSFTGISQSSGSIRVITSQPTRLSLRYGTSPNKLTAKVRTSSYQHYANISIPDLTPQTTYYFQITATDSQGNTVSSEIYSFKTAQVSQLSEVNRDTLIIASNDTVLFSASLEKLDALTIPQIILPGNTDYQITFKLTKREAIRSISAIVQNGLILGFATPAVAETTYMFESPLAEIQPGIFFVALSTPPTPGLHDITIQIKDAKGNLIQQNIAAVKTISPMAIYDKDGKQPIEHARIFITHWNASTHRYELLQQTNGFSNPGYTDYNGEIAPVLAKGKYKADISALGYTNKTITFSLGIQNGQEYPTVFLEKTPLSLITTSTYFITTFHDLLDETNTFLQKVIPSTRLFDLVSAMIIGCLVLISFLFFAFHTHMSLKMFDHYVFHHTRKVFGKHKEFVFGRVVDEETKNPVKQADVFLVDAKTDKIISETKTNGMGTFYTNQKYENQHVAVTVMKPGYEQTNAVSYDPTSHGITGIRIALKKQAGEIPIQTSFLLSIQMVLGLLFETTLVLSLCTELLFGLSIGWIKTAPFFVLSCLNILLWIWHRNEKIQ